MAGAGTSRVSRPVHWIRRNSLGLSALPVVNRPSTVAGRWQSGHGTVLGIGVLVSAGGQVERGPASTSAPSERQRSGMASCTESQLPARDRDAARVVSTR